MKIPSNYFEGHAVLSSSSCGVFGLFLACLTGAMPAAGCCLWRKVQSASACWSACDCLLYCRCYVNSSNPSSLSLTRPEVLAVWEELEKARDTLAEMQALRMEVASDTGFFCAVEGPEQVMDDPLGSHQTKGQRKKVQGVTSSRRTESVIKSKGKQKTTRPLVRSSSRAAVHSQDGTAVQSNSAAAVQSPAGKKKTSIKR